MRAWVVKFQRDEYHTGFPLYGSLIEAKFYRTKKGASEHRLDTEKVIPVEIKEVKQSKVKK